MRAIEIIEARNGWIVRDLDKAIHVGPMRQDEISWVYSNVQQLQAALPLLLANPQVTHEDQE